MDNHTDTSTIDAVMIKLVATIVICFIGFGVNGLSFLVFIADPVIFIPAIFLSRKIDKNWIVPTIAIGLILSLVLYVIMSELSVHKPSELTILGRFLAFLLMALLSKKNDKLIKK